LLSSVTHYPLFVREVHLIVRCGESGHRSSVAIVPQARSLRLGRSPKCERAELGALKGQLIAAQAKRSACLGFGSKITFSPFFQFGLAHRAKPNWKKERSVVGGLSQRGGFGGLALG